MSSLPEGDWAVAKSQRRMTQHEVKIVCQDTTPWKTGIFLIERVDFFTGGWVSCCWVPKRDDAGNEKNDCMTDEENRKGKYKHHVFVQLNIRKFFHSQVKLPKTVINSLQCAQFLWSDEFFIKCQKKKKKEGKKERSILFPFISFIR